jgi:ribose/xylose/arabinose/galactoside ABC-type transport system permease subunit
LTDKGGAVAQGGPDTGVAWRDHRYARLRLTGNEVRLAVLIVLVVIFATASPFFLTAVNISNILLAAAVVGVVACAQTLLLVAGQVDISVGSAVAFASAVFAVMAQTFGIPVAILGCIVAALIVAGVNVLGIVHFRVSSIIVTLATFIMFRGVARIVLDGRAVQVKDFGLLGQTKFTILGIDVHLAILVLLVVAVLFYLLMSRTRYGQHMYAIGANSRAARLAGIPLERDIIIAFALSGLTVAVASLLLTSQTGVVDPTTGDRLEFLALTGVMIGGASLHGGRGSVSGTLMAIVILAVFDNGLVLMQVPSFYQEVFRGALLLAAVIFDEAQRRSRDVRMRI